MVPLNLYTDLYRPLVSAVNTQQGGFIRPQTNFENWVNEVSDEIFREMMQELERNQVITDEMAPFLKSINAITVPQPGRSYDLIAYPDDYAYFSSARILLSGNNTGCACDGLDVMDGKGICKAWTDTDVKDLMEKYKGSDLCEMSITKIDNQRWGAACDNEFKKPTMSNPIITQFEGGFKVAPKNAGIIILDYLKMPRKAVFGYTLGANDVVIYNAGTSTQLEWSRSKQGEFLARLIKRYGMYTREPFLYQGGEMERQINK